jgi:hypothetical protein
MNAYLECQFAASKKRFSDEFYRGFHLANDKERGSTTNITIIDDKLFLDWERTEENPDIITVNLRDKLAPNQKLNYSSHILSSLE